MRHLRDPVPSVRSAVPTFPTRGRDRRQGAMAKRPGDRFPSTEAMIAAIEAPSPTTRARAPARPRPQASSSRRAALSAPGRGSTEAAPAAQAPPLLAARPGRFWSWAPAPSPWRSSSPAGTAAVPARPAPRRGRADALEDYDPQGDGSEHPEPVANATDGDAATFWTTETYRDVRARPGVGIDPRRGRGA